jgi:ABC-2 type transport system ATP-binding protein
MELPMSAILIANDLVKSYNSHPAVAGISFEILNGEIFSLLGPNGAGKTTTISMLSTLLKPTQGDAVIAGYSITRQPFEVRRMIGVVPQEIALYDTLTARENLLFWGSLYDMGGKTLHQRTEQILEQIGLTDRAADKVETYSGGMKRRLNIGVGLLHNPKIIFMDEPTVGIDPQSRRNILDTVKDLNANGLSVLYTTHYMEEAAELSHRVGIIDQGKMIACGTQEELTQQIGEHRTLQISFVENEVDGEISQSVAALPEVLSASLQGNQLVALVEQPNEALGPVVQLLSRMNLTIRSVEIQEPNLEGVFLRLTGRGLRD